MFTKQVYASIIFRVKIKLYFMNVDIVIIINTEMPTKDSSFCNLFKLIGQQIFAETSAIKVGE